MKKTVYINLAGKNYPLNFSLGTCKVINKELGGLENFDAALGGGLNEDTIEKIVTILHTLISQGCTYKNIFEIDAGIFIDEVENPAFDEEGHFKPLTKEMIELAIGIEDIEEIVNKINESVKVSSDTEVEVKQLKNEKAPKEVKV